MQDKARDLGVAAQVPPGSRPTDEAGQSALPVSTADAASIPNAVEPVFQYRFSERRRSDGSKSERHDWCLIHKSGAINIWAEPYSREAGFGERWFGGVECHWASPPSCLRSDKPSQEHCWLINRPCWHDGSSLFFSERIEPHLPDPNGRQMDGSANDLMQFHLRDWFNDKIAVGEAETPNTLPGDHR